MVFTSSGGKDAARNWLQRENIYCIGSNKLNLILHHKGSNGFDLSNTSVLLSISELKQFHAVSSEQKESYESRNSTGNSIKKMNRVGCVEIECGVSTLPDTGRFITTNCIY